jgi:hypothetical protein
MISRTKSERPAYQRGEVERQGEAEGEAEGEEGRVEGQDPETGGDEDHQRPEQQGRWQVHPKIQLLRVQHSAIDGPPPSHAP